jgi:hypothetical protein
MNDKNQFAINKEEEEEDSTSFQFPNWTFLPLIAKINRARASLTHSIKA